jgi:hypothetical protein
MKHLIAILAVTAVMATACDKKNDAATPGSDANTAAPAVPVADRSTAAGTLTLFAQAMAEADYPAAMALIDETCEGYAEIISTQDALDAAEGKGDETISLKPLFVMAFTRAWQDVKIEQAGESEGAVRYQLVFARKPPVMVDVRNATGQWLVVAGKDLVVIEMPEGMEAPPEMPVAPPAVVPPEAPADTPTGG